jgi:hypothetical protein
VTNSIREIAASSKTEIRTSSISGKGCFAREKIAQGEYLFTLSGEIIQSDPDVTALCMQLGISADDPLQIDDAQFLICNLEAKTINHSCEPNACLRNQRDLYAIRDINVDEEITYDYSTTSGTNDKWVMSCGCGSALCRKVVGNVLTLPAIIIAKYIRLNAFPNFISRQIQNHR